jgi:hypothetical protein
VRPLARVQFHMPFEIVEAAETGIAVLAQVWLLVAMRKKMTLEIVVAREFRRTVWAFVFLIRRRRLGLITWHARVHAHISPLVRGLRGRQWTRISQRLG